MSEEFEKPGKWEEKMGKKCKHEWKYELKGNWKKEGTTAHYVLVCPKCGIQKTI